MEFTLSVYNSLTQFFDWSITHVGSFPRIRFKATIIFSVSDSFNGLIAREYLEFGYLMKVETVFKRALTVQCIAGMYILQFHCTTDVTGYHFLYLDTVGTGTSINLRDAFL